MERDEILQQRAERLAARTAASAEVLESIEVVEVRVGPEHFGFVSAWVREVIARPPITSLPHLPSHLRGVTTVRGEVVGVVDLARCFGLASAGEAFLVVVAAPKGPVGLLVDAVIGNRRVPAPKQETAAASSRPLLGVTSEGLQLLDAQRLVEETAAGRQA